MEPPSNNFAADANGWTPTGGTWTVQDGYYRSSKIEIASMSLSERFDDAVLVTEAEN